MKRFGLLLLAGSIFFNNYSSASAQSSGAASIRDPNERARLARERERQEMKEDLQDLRFLEKLKSMSNKENPDPFREKQLLIAKELRRLNDESAALLAASKEPGEKSFKESSKRADKIAKISKQLRQTLMDQGATCKVEPMPLPPMENRNAQLALMAETIDKVVDQVNESIFEATQVITVSGPAVLRANRTARYEQAMKKLEILECQALSARDFAKGKID
jgi:hypothetical protein